MGKATEAVNYDDDDSDTWYADKKSTAPNLTYELSDFNYKSALILDENKKDENSLRQNSAAVNLQFEQSDIKEITYSYTIIGTAFNGYLFIECNDNIFIFDQHAAHERLIYEDFMEIYGNKFPLTQKLLIPQTIELPYDDILTVKENIETFNQAGYLIKINDLSVEITGVPMFLGQPQMSGFFKEILANLQSGGANESSAEEKIISMSCKKAVKVGDRLTDKEIKKLIDLILNNDIKLTCPHGRPFVSVITKNQLEKRFGRIV